MKIPELARLPGDWKFRIPSELRSSILEGLYHERFRTLQGRLYYCLTLL